MGNSILLTDMTPDELASIIDTKLKGAFDDLLNKLKGNSTSNDLLSRAETCELLKIDSSTLWHWTNKGKVKAHGIGARRYYKRSELMEALTPCN